VDAPRIPRRQVVPFDAEQANKLLEAASGSRYEAVYELALKLGMRRGELLGLRWADVDLDGRTLRVSQSMQRVATGSEAKGKKTALVTGDVKTDGSRRTIALPDSVVKALRAHKARQAQERLTAGPSWRDGGLVFTNRTGQPTEPIVLHRDYKAILEKAKLPIAMRFHDLRHSAASLLLAQGVSPKMIADLLGHSRIGITMDLYSHILPAMRRDTADAMDQILGSRQNWLQPHRRLAFVQAMSASEPLSILAERGIPMQHQHQIIMQWRQQVRRRFGDANSLFVISKSNFREPDFCR
jgi:integrase